jgi:NAD dependent epimerase/dehydratase family enzyme
VNVTTSDPPRQAEFAAALAQAMGVSARLRTPAWVLQTFMGEKAGLVLRGQRAVPNLLKAHGFRWEFAELERALADLV